MVVYTARHVLPVATPPVADGAVAVDGPSIVDVGPRGDVLARAGEGAELRELGDAVLMPGLVNAHTHLELSWMGDDPPPGGEFLTWLRAFIALRATEDDDVAWQAAERAVERIVARGTVALGDIANGIWSASILARSPLYAVVFHELLGFPVTLAERLLDEAAGRLDAIEADGDVAAAAGRIRIALTPHAPHTTAGALIKALAGRAEASHAPLSIHVAESAVEVEFLHDGGGPFERFLRELDAWDEGWAPTGQSPVEVVDRLGALRASTLVVHAVHLSKSDLSLMQARGVTAVTCPRSNERLGVGVAPVPDMLRAGIPVAIGTDSLASSPDLDMFAEMAALRAAHPRLAAAAVVRMATLNGARALGFEELLGSIEPGKRAALVAVPLGDPGDDPLETVCSNPAEVTPLIPAPREEGPA